eukprot:327046_1
MGKKDFGGLYKEIQSAFGNMTLKVSLFSDDYENGKSYAGLIIYKIDGQMKWKNPGGKCGGYSCRSGYAIIMCTDKYPSQAFKRAGQGVIHDYLIKAAIGIEYSQDRVCCSGFGYHNGNLSFNSIWLNGRDQRGGASDGKGGLCYKEQKLVEYLWSEFKTKKRGAVIAIPNWLNAHLR